MKLLCIIWLFCPGFLLAQNQEIKLLSHNIIFGGLSAGVGAVINKKQNENWKKSFVRGCWQGSIGGLLNYAAKKSIVLIDKNNSLVYAIPGRIISSAGNSIIQNAAANGPFLENWSLEYCFLRFDFGTHSQQKFKARVLPVSLIGSVIAVKQGRLDLSTTLLTGVMAFKSKDLITTLNGSYDGVNYGRTFIYTNDTAKYHLISHEIVHEYQYREHMVFNAYLKKGVSKLKETGLKKTVTKYVYPDLPYFGIFYMLEQTERGPRFFRNYFEFEAERFATGRHVQVN